MLALLLHSGTTLRPPVFQRTLQFFSCTSQSRHNSAGWAIQYFGDLQVAQVLKLAQDNHFAVDGWQVFHRPVYILAFEACQIGAQWIQRDRVCAVWQF